MMTQSLYKIRYIIDPPGEQMCGQVLGDTREDRQEAHGNLHEGQAYK
jgi:hypothetical protein